MPAMGMIFVTGGTGFIGRYLVERLAIRGSDVAMLVRPERVEAHRDRLEHLAGIAAVHGGSLRVVEGDLSDDSLGLSTSDEVLLGRDLEAVFHVAALYDLTASEERLNEVNVEGTRRLLACLSGLGFDGILHHVSSIAVAGDHEGVFSEDALDVGQSHPHPYHRSKYESERLVRESGLRTRIYRPGAVVGDSRTGEVDKADGLYYAFPLMRKLRDALPRWVRVPIPNSGSLPIVPVDFVADAIDHIAQLSDVAGEADLDGQAFHVVDPQPPRLVETLNLLSSAAGGPRFTRLPTRPGRPGRKSGASPFLQVAKTLGSVRFFRDELLAGLSVPTEVADLAGTSTQYGTERLLGALEGSGLECPEPAAYIPLIWDYWLRRMDPERDAETVRRRAFAGKRVLVTGASGGIGEAVARELGVLGAVVFLVARRESELATVTEAIRTAGGSAHYYVADLSEMESCDALGERVSAEHGGVDILINNAGRSIRRTVADSLERFHDLERLMSINYFGPARLMAAFLPGMRERGFGQIVNALSAGTHMPGPQFGPYTASKAALAQLGDTLGGELAHEGIFVTSAFLPFVRTPMMDATGKFDETPAMTSEEAAVWMLDATAERRAHVIPPRARIGSLAKMVAPGAAARFTNALHRIYSDDPTSHPGFEVDRMLAKKFVRGRPF